MVIFNIILANCFQIDLYFKLEKTSFHRRKNIHADRSYNNLQFIDQTMNI